METPDAPRYRVPDDIAWIDGTEIGLGEELYLTRLPSGDTVQLAGTARMIWHAVIAGGDVADRVSDSVSVPTELIRDEVERFISALVSSALLVPR